MYISRGKSIKKYFVFLLALFVLTSCATDDTPFTLASPSDGSDTTPTGSGNVPPGTGEGCVVNFVGQMQLQLSAEGTGDIIGSRFIDIDPIPINFDGSNVALHGSTFPDIIPFLGDEPPADMIINGEGAGNVGSGTYDASTGRLEINNFKFLVKVYPPGDAGGSELGRIESIPPVTFTTDSGQVATGSGPTPQITVDGQPYSAADGSITMVVALTLPDKLGSLDVIDDSIGGGALTAVFKGSLDQDPSNCSEGGGGTTPSGGGGPSEFSVSVGSDSKLTEIDFGSTLVLVTSQGGKTILDCTQASNRGAIGKLVTITNTGEGDRVFKLLKTVDTDDDAKDPLCSGKSEFVRGAIVTHGSANCGTVTVGGKDFGSDECTIPAGDSEAKITFPLIYMPFNYVKPPEGEGSKVDTGNLLIEYDQDKSFAVSLKGITEPDTRDSLSVSKVKSGVVSKKEVRDNGLLKIALSDTTPFTQDYVLKNASGDSWENISMSLSGQEGGTAFAVVAPTTTSLGPQADADNPGTLGFGITFTPDSSGSNSFEDTLTITLTKAGTTAETTLTYKILGTVGIDPILGNYQLKIDYMSALIANSLQRNRPPVESLDFRNFPTQSPKGQLVNFGDLNEEEVQPLDLLPDLFDLDSSTVEDRKTALRILNAQASGLVPGDDSTMCNEPQNINQVYPDFSAGEKWDCAYFYFNLNTKEGVTGVYDEETGSFTIPEIELRIQNPYHGVVGGGVWPKSQHGQPYPNDYKLDSTLDISLTTSVLDKLEENGMKLVTDPRITRGQLNLSGLEDWMGPECPDKDTINQREDLTFQCYLTSDGKYIRGKEVSLRKGETDIYDVILVGVGRFNSNTTPNDLDIPVFMHDSNMYLIIQARLCPEGADCTFKD